MKKLIAVVLAVVMLASISGVVMADKPDDAIDNSNGAPSGQHFNLNIIGVPQDKIADMDANNDNGIGNRIFVALDEDGTAAITGKYGTKILLTSGDFAVLDANGTDSDGAAFRLPNPDPNMDGVTDYSVYARAVGKPGGTATMQTCYTDSTGTWCAIDLAGGIVPITIGPHNGKPIFTNVSRDLLYIDYCANWVESNGTPGFQASECTDVDQYPLFGGPGTITEYFWDYDNNGLKLAQLRFYVNETTDTGLDPGPEG